MYVSPAYRLKLYRNFKAIDAKDPYGIIRYYEQYEEELRTLETDEYIDCTLAYTDALFDTDDYARHLVMCDYLIELIMKEGIYYWGGEDLFCRLLHVKAVSLYNSGRLNEAINVLIALVKISPQQAQTAQLLSHYLQQEKTPGRMKGRAISLLIIFLAALAAGATGLIIKPFFQDYINLATQITGGMLITGVSMLVFTELRHYEKSHRTVRRLVKAK